MVLFFWVINLFSIFSSFSAILVLLIITVKCSEIRSATWRLLIVISAFGLSYATGALTFLMNTGFSLPSNEQMSAYPERINFQYLLIFIINLGIFYLLPSSVHHFFNKKSLKGYLYLGSIVFLLLIVPSILFMIHPVFFHTHSQAFRILNLIAVIAVMEYGVLYVLYYRSEIHEKYRRILTLLCAFFTFPMIPLMGLEDLFIFLSITNSYNIMEAIGFFFMMTSILLMGIVYLSGLRSEPDLLNLEENFGLTAREGEVLQCLLQGDSNKEIALHLNISPDTVKTHVSRIYRKTGVSARQELKYKIHKLG